VRQQRRWEGPREGGGEGGAPVGDAKGRDERGLCRGVVDEAVQQTTQHLVALPTACSPLSSHIQHKGEWLPLYVNGSYRWACVGQ
jgi:hypothetical protein